MTTPNHDKESGDLEAGELTNRDGMAVRYQIHVVTGEEAQLLRRRQARAIRALLVWLANEGENEAEQKRAA
jgi:hypothetical protein